MSVILPSDLVADVMKAASPAREQAAARKLAVHQAPSGFAARLDLLLSQQPRAGDLPGDLVMDVMANAQPQKLAAAEEKLAASTPRHDMADPYQKFESFMLRNAIEDMLPAAESGAYGEGFAGGMWRSMAADQLADLLAARGGLGIAQTLRARETQDAAKPAGQWPYFQTQAIHDFATG
ncbi:rod-binding protein [Aestuariivirga sp.]|uniref:rod-binding protein n=1 Tax=Aestuariivirga sp. TaxID=2650926 RepID=UPI0039E64089